MKESKIRCSFCNRNKDEVRILIAGAEGHICENCVANAQEIIEQELNPGGEARKAAPSHFAPKVAKPVEIKHFPDEYVIGQDDAKKILAVAVYNHYKRLNQQVMEDEVEIEKSNLIMVGETGTGKTSLLATRGHHAAPRLAYAPGGYRAAEEADGLDHAMGHRQGQF